MSSVVEIRTLIHTVPAEEHGRIKRLPGTVEVLMRHNVLSIKSLRAAAQEVSHHLRKPKLYFRVHNSCLSRATEVDSVT
jgi:hypothetical protein